MSRNYNIYTIGIVGRSDQQSKNLNNRGYYCKGPIVLKRAYEVKQILAFSWLFFLWFSLATLLPTNATLRQCTVFPWLRCHDYDANFMHEVGFCYIISKGVEPV